MSQTLNPNGTYYAYLRKSRADRDAEAHGEGETLARHEHMLQELAGRLHITISRFYREIVSAETIQDRPAVHELLHDISNGHCDGVLVVEVERLARGDTNDQGTIAKCFKFSETPIITPAKIYDPNDEFDEEYFEFGLFMSRREYKTINRRIQRGRTASVKEGKWIASTAPYGYERVKLKEDKGYTLKILPEQAKIIRLIYDLYLNGEVQEDGSKKRLGHYLICKKLDSMGIRPANSKQWSPSSIKDILNNHTYIGKVCWGKEIQRNVFEDGKVKKIREKNSDFQIYDGLHPAIIEESVFWQVQALKEARPISPVVSNKILKNPLSGILRCGKCGSLMTRVKSSTKDNYYSLMCPNRSCSNVSAPLYLLEEKTIESLKNWLDGYHLTYENINVISLADEISIKEDALRNCETELQSLQEQKKRTYDLLEQGVYTVDIFQERLALLTDKISASEQKRLRLQNSLRQDRKTEYDMSSFIPNVRHVIEAYRNTEDASAKNELLKNVLSHIDYIKDAPNKKFQRNNANFQLDVFPKLPEYKNL